MTQLASPINVNENLTIHPLIPPEAGVGWNFEFFELAEAIPAHYHKLQRQIILVADGKLKVCCDNQAPIALQKSDLIHINPGVIHALIPERSSRFFAIDLPGFAFHEDVFYGVPETKPQWIPSQSDYLPHLDSDYFGPKIDAGDYAAYEIVPGHATDKRWSVALLEIHDSPKHFHLIEKEIFIVVSGNLDIEIDGAHQILATGDFVVIYPTTVHQLRSAGHQPVRVLCFNFPAFDPLDMHY